MMSAPCLVAIIGAIHLGRRGVLCRLIEYAYAVQNRVCQLREHDLASFLTAFPMRND